MPAGVQTLNGFVVVCGFSDWVSLFGSKDVLKEKVTELRSNYRAWSSHGWIHAASPR
jgi:hypothetical protein